MKEELLKRLTGKSLAESVQGCSGLKLGAKSKRRMFNIKKLLYNKKDGENGRGNCINYINGMALATNGYYAIANLEDYSEIYEEVRVNYVTGNVFDNISPSIIGWENVIKGTAATRYINTEDMLQAIDNQQDEHDKIKGTRQTLAQEIKNGIDGGICFKLASSATAILTISQCQAIKQFIKQCGDIGGCAIGFSDYQSNAIKIVASGLVMLVSCLHPNCYRQIDAAIDITDKIKPISK